MDRIAKIKELLDEKKALDIMDYDLRDKDYFVDYVIVATTMADKHGAALLDHLKKTLKPMGETFLGIDESEDWIVIDLGDILIHLMSEEYRAKYQMDKFLEEIKSRIRP
ncbi:ribosome-associated protein [Lebetimonas natsushimae]|uniref:Ribosomal silencing factor RsfS n=1 Tax=Lebetimonas natsushimae TaxID=1936991 RepID=A0A292YET7_9BACT|nr:ribosome silencing factor [Lebetimonas natsushimae]GAX87759.1 ribosome-associated protein [Lebetimonas natsushimae]